MRPRMVPDTYPVAVEGGAYLLTPRGPVRLSGASIGLWVERLAPHLDGRRTLAELTDGLAPDRRAMVERIVTVLAERGVVVDADAELSGPAEPARSLSPVECAEYQPELDYLATFPGPAAARFAGYRYRTALVVGEGPSARALVAAAFQSGLRRVRVTGDIGPAQIRDPEQRLEVLPPPGADRLPELSGRAGLVLHAFHEAADPRIGDLEQACAAADIPLTQLMLADDEAWLMPVGPGGGARWSSVRRRLAALPRPKPEASPATGAPSGTGAVSTGGDASGAVAAPSPAAVTVLAGQLVQSAFRALAAADTHPPDSTGSPPHQVTRVRPDTWRSRSHRVLPHPYELPATPGTAGHLEARLTELARRPRLTDAEFSQRATGAMDEQLGVFMLDEHDWAQSPLQVCQARVADPVGLAGAAGAPRVIGAGFTYEGARCAAARDALAHYASLMVDPRRLVDPATGRPLPEGHDPDRLLARVRDGSVAAATWGYEIARPDRVRPVPAATAFPWLADPGVPPVGLAAGYDWVEAVTNGLLDHVRQRALAALSAATDPYPAVALDLAGLSGDGASAGSLLADLEELPEVYDLTGPDGVATYACCRGGDTVAVTAGATNGAALADGLVQVVRAVQADIHGQRDYAPPPLPALPARLRGSPGARAVTGVPDPRSLADRLPPGEVAVAVPLDHDPHVAGILPFLVQVVVMEDG